MRFLIFLAVTLSSLSLFAEDKRVVSEAAVEVARVAAVAEAVNVGIIMAGARELIVRGSTDAQVKTWISRQISSLGILRKISLTGLAYIVGDFTGTQIYNNLSADNQEALGEIVYLMVQNSKEYLGMKPEYLNRRETNGATR